MADLIQANYETLTEITNQFATGADEVRNMNTRIENGVDNLRTGFYGDAAEKFQNEMHNDVLPALKRLADALEDAKATTNKIKDVFQKAEQEAASAFPSE